MFLYKLESFDKSQRFIHTASNWKIIHGNLDKDSLLKKFKLLHKIKRCTLSWKTLHIFRKSIPCNVEGLSESDVLY